MHLSLSTIEAKLHSFFVCFPCSYVRMIIYCQFEAYKLITQVFNIKSIFSYYDHVRIDSKNHLNVNVGLVLFSLFLFSHFKIFARFWNIPQFQFSCSQKCIFATQSLFQTATSRNVLYLKHCNSLLKFIVIRSNLCNKI